MPIEQLIILALIQGITEFLPISSSAHLVLLPALTTFEDQGALMDVAVHLGSLGAVMLYFRKDVVHLVEGTFDLALFKDTAARTLVLWLIVGTIPTIIVGGVLYATGLNDQMRSAVVIGWSTIIFGVVLLWADKTGSRSRAMESMTFKDALAVGLAQCLALIPGTSRSGITLTAALRAGFQRTDAARFSMLLAIPTILAFGLIGALEVATSGDTTFQSEALLAVFLSFVSAFAAIWLFMHWLERMSLLPFVLYRLVLGIGLLIYVYGFGGGAAG